MGELSRKERERAEHWRAILEAAEAVFAERGYHGAAVQGIAERAEFSVGYLYSHFASKEDMLASLVELRVGEFIGEMEECLKSDAEPMEKIRQAIATKLHFLERHKRFFTIFVSYVHSSESPRLPVSRRIHEMHRAYVSGLAEVFAAAIRAGAIRLVDPKVAAACMEGMTNAVIGQWVADGAREADAPQPEPLQRLLLEGLLPREGGA